MTSSRTYRCASGYCRCRFRCACCLAAQPKLVTPVLQVVHRAITRLLLDQAGLKADQADSGAVTLIQRFGSAANLIIHLHCLVLDGVYRRTDGEPVFVEVPAPTDEDLQALLHKIIGRSMKLLTRRGVLLEEQGSTYLANGDADSDDARAQAAAGRCRPLQALIESPSARVPGRRFSRCKAPCREAPRSPKRCVPTRRVSACTVRCAALARSASGWSSFAATSHARHWPMSGCSATAPGRSCSS